MYNNEYKGKDVLVLGLGKSGLAAAKLLVSLGANVTLNDLKQPEQAVLEELNKLEKSGVSLLFGSHPEKLLDNKIDLIVKNPGIKYDNPVVQKALAKNIKIITEIELAYKVVSADYICITGSNGKTTTTSLVGFIMERAKLEPWVGGNIGVPLSELAIASRDDLCSTTSANKRNVVLELSSFQLLGVDSLKPQIAAITNLYETHLDYHGTMADYYEAKLRITMNQDDTDYLVLNSSQLVFNQIAKKSKAQVVWCHNYITEQDGVSITSSDIIYREQNKELVICKIDDIKLPGKHNLENVLFAVAISIIKGIEPSIIKASLQEFKGVEHRLEHVATINGVDYYNDSKATNQHATIRALNSFDRPIVLIAGGLDRGNDFDELAIVLRHKVRHLITYGETAIKLHSTAQLVNIEVTISEDLLSATELAMQIAKTKDVVLLSPACASWDMFKSFELRGQLFKDVVLNNKI